MAAQATAQTKKRLALAIIDFLQTSSTDGSIEAEDSEQLEIAQNCIAEAFKVDPTDEEAVKDATGGQNLLAIYNVYEKLKGKNTSAGASTSGSAPASGSSEKKDAPTGDKTEAERLKGLGNDAMKRKDHAAAVDFYTQALDILPLNPIYLSNRAAAYSGMGKHEEAKNDAEMAVAADPKYSKAWSRLGLAKYVLGDVKGAMEAYKSGIDAEGNGGSEVMRKGYETAKRRVEEEGGDVGAPEESSRGGAGGAGGMPDLSSLASMLGGAGGGAGGAGGMPDFASMMQNPMIRQMATNMMQNPDMMANMMNNPRIAELAQQFAPGGGRGGSGGGPDLSSLMNDPSIAEMARNFMGGMGGAGRGGQ